MADNDLISRSALLERLSFKRMADMKRNIYPGLESAIAQVKKAPAVDAVSRQAFDQILWELDIARQQLKDHNIPFGGVAPDVVNVVRCKDCKRCYKHITKRHKQTMWLCMRHDLEVCVRPDDFCSYGERREDDGKRSEAD